MADIHKLANELEVGFKTHNSALIDQVIDEMAGWKPRTKATQENFACLSQILHKDKVLPEVNIEGIDRNNHFLQTSLRELDHRTFYLDHYGFAHSQRECDHPRALAEISKDLTSAFGDRTSPEARSKFEFALYELTKKMTTMDSEGKFRAMVALNKTLADSGFTSFGTIVGIDSKSHTMIFANEGTNTLTTLGGDFFSNGVVHMSEVQPVTRSPQIGKRPHLPNPPDNRGKGGEETKEEPGPRDRSDISDEADERTTNDQEKRTRRLLEGLSTWKALQSQLETDARTAHTKQIVYGGACVALVAVVGVLAAPEAAAAGTVEQAAGGTFIRAAFGQARMLNAALGW